MPNEWTISRLRGGWALVFWQDGKRRRHSLGTASKSEAERLAPALFAQLTAPGGATVRELWEGYTRAKHGKAVLETMRHTYKALDARFGPMEGHLITTADCRAHTDARRKAGIKDGTIHTELGHLRMVLLWATEEKLIPEAPKIERPPKPLPKDKHLTKREVGKLIAAARKPHVKLAIALLLATAARVSAITELTWDRVDFKRRQIHLRDPDDPVKRKGRAVVPINNSLMPSLKEAHVGRQTDFVVEWAGKPVGDLKRGIATAATGAGFPWVTPHVFRHTAAVWMAEAGRSMDEIAQYLGHNDVATTRKVYARFSPDHLREAASSLEWDTNEVPGGSDEPDEENGE